MGTASHALCGEGFQRQACPDFTDLFAPIAGPTAIEAAA